MVEKSFLFDVASKIYVATDGTPVHMQTYELCCDMIDVVLDISCIYGFVLRVFFLTFGKIFSRSVPVENEQQPISAGIDSKSSCVIKLNTSQVLYLRQVNRYLALVSIVRTENFEKQGDFFEVLFKKYAINIFRQ
jgi:Ras-related GTP-binding protein C/D